MKIFFPALVMFFMLANAARSLGVKEGAPPGFSELAKPQQSQITIYYGGNSLGSYAAKFRPGFVQLQEPEKLIEQIGNISDKPQLTRVLGAEHAANAGLVCGRKKN